MSQSRYSNDDNNTISLTTQYIYWSLPIARGVLGRRVYIQGGPIVVLKTLDISQGSVATHLRCGGIFSDSIITHFLLILTVK